MSTLFQFNHLKVGRKTKFERVSFTLDDVRNVYIEWQEFMRDNELLPTLFIENHDTARNVNFHGNADEYRYESATLLATMYFLQSGIPFIYQGQEIGVTNSWHTDINEFNDIETHNFYNINPFELKEEELMKRINFGSRDNARRPMPWDGSEDGGFGSTKSWLPFYVKQKEINVEADKMDEKSVFCFYKQLVNIRKDNNAIRHGIYSNLTENRTGCYIYKMTDTVANKSIVVVCNFEKENEIALELSGNCVLSNYKNRDQIPGTYKPYECAVFEV